MTKIAFISTMEGSPWGGSEELWSQAALCLAQQGHQILVNVKNWGSLPPPISVLKAAGCSITLRAYGQSRVERLKRKLNPDYLYQWLDQTRPHLTIISQGSHLEGMAWIHACAERKVPFATVAQAAHTDWWPDDKFATEAAALFGKAKRCYFVSQRNLDLTRVQLTDPLKNAKVVRNPFHVSYHAHPAWPKSDEPIRLACIGRLHPAAKGQDILFEVLRQDKWRERPLVVDLYGEGPNKLSLEKLKQIYRLENVHFAGQTASIEEVWQTHHALVLPSRYEGLPLVIVEAMLCGRACIVTNVAGNAELLQDGVTGFVADAPTPNLLDDALERAWQKRTDWQIMGERAAKHIRTQIPCDPAADFANELIALTSIK